MKVKHIAIACLSLVVGAFACIGGPMKTDCLPLEERIGPVLEHGALFAGKNSAGKGRIYGTALGAGDGLEVQVRGMSLSWSQNWPYGSSFYGASYLDSLVEHWNVEVVRAAMGVVPPWGHGSYMTNPEYFESVVDTVVHAAIKNNVYVLIDWHSEGGYYNCLHKNAPVTDVFNDNKACFTAADAANFFERMARKYGQFPHVIFEIYNEPVSESWDELKAYADTVIAAIRKHSDNLIIMGTPFWSSEAGKVVQNPVDDKNIAYTYHFYANMHKFDQHSASSEAAMNAGLAIFVTEWGGIHDIFNKASDKEELEKFLKWTDENKLSYAMWNVEKPYLEDNDVDNYTKANILPQKRAYTQNVATIDGAMTELPKKYVEAPFRGTWSSFSDKNGNPDSEGDFCATTYTETFEDGVLKIENVKLDTVGTGFAYAPHVRIDFTPDIKEYDIQTAIAYSIVTACPMIAYEYKGSNHQFQAFADWNRSVAVWGVGAWDYPYVPMPYSPDWTNAVVDFKWMRTNGWQGDLPTDKVDARVVTGLRFEITNVNYGKDLYIKNIRCVSENSTSIEPRKPLVQNAPFKFQVAERRVSFSGVKSGSRYSLMSVNGQVIANGIAQGTHFAIDVPYAGVYMLKIGNITQTIKVQ